MSWIPRIPKRYGFRETTLHEILQDEHCDQWASNGNPHHPPPIELLVKSPKTSHASPLNGCNKRIRSYDHHNLKPCKPKYAINPYSSRDVFY
jgi:hypothetical protein